MTSSATTLPHNAKHVAGSRDNTLRVWDVDTAQSVQVLQGHQYQVRAWAMLKFVPSHWLHNMLGHSGLSTSLECAVSCCMKHFYAECCV